jgi:hypothetical protein
MLVHKSGSWDNICRQYPVRVFIHLATQQTLLTYLAIQQTLGELASMSSY